MTQTEIDQRETARVEAILQVAKWALQEAAAYSAPSLRCVRYLAAIQHDADPGLEAFRRGLVMEGLDTLAEHWHELPEGERDVVLAGILGGTGAERGALDPDDGVDPWLDLLGHQSALRIVTRAGDPEERVRVERDYAQLLRRLTDAVVSA